MDEVCSTSGGKKRLYRILMVNLKEKTTWKTQA
jgi:hypothetical protein